MKKNRILKLIKISLILYIVYFILTGIIIFAVPYNRDFEIFDTSGYFCNSKSSNDRIVLLEDPHDALKCRIDLIKNTQRSLDIVYYLIENGVSSDTFYAEILNAADRGVKVRIIFDGIFHNLISDYRAIKYALISHPNIEIKFYEPFNVFKPWTINNRLHDKFLISDKKYAITGGRNIGDRYFFKSESKLFVNDRDVLVYSKNSDNYSASVLSEIVSYYDSMWTYENSKNPNTKITDRRIKKAILERKKIEKVLEEQTKKYPYIYSEEINWDNRSVKANNIKLVSNSLTRFKKDPVVLKTLTSFIANSNFTIIQSPYVIPSKDIQNIFSKITNKTNITILTNSISSNPNLFSLAGYTKHKNSIIDSSYSVYEYVGDNSIHAKSYIFSSSLCAVGTFNLDSRSAFLSTESMLIIDSPEFTNRLSSAICNLENSSQIVDKEKKDSSFCSTFKNIIVKIFYIILYGFDYML